MKAPDVSELIDMLESKAEPTSHVQCPFCSSAYTPDTLIECEHRVGEGDPEYAPIGWMWPLLDELITLANEANDAGIDIGKLARGIRGWETLMPEDQEDMLEGVPGFLMDAPGFRYRSRHYDCFGPMSGCYFWVFVVPRSRAKVEAEFKILKTRLVRAIATKEGPQ